MSTKLPWRGRRRRTAALLGAAAAFSLVLAPAAQAAQRCSNPEDQAVFELEALKTELMVVATTCKGNNEDRYNAFVTRYRPALVESNRRLGQYFTRAHGRTGSGRTTSSSPSWRMRAPTSARTLGGDYCPRNSGLFEEVMALPNVTDLPAYAATKDLLSPASPPAPAARRPAPPRPPAAEPPARAAHDEQPRPYWPAASRCSAASPPARNRPPAPLPPSAGLLRDTQGQAAPAPCRSAYR